MPKAFAMNKQWLFSTILLIIIGLVATACTAASLRCQFGNRPDHRDELTTEQCSIPRRRSSYSAIHLDRSVRYRSRGTFGR